MADTVAARVDDAIARLRVAGVASPEADVWSIVAWVTGLSRGQAQAKALVDSELLDPSQISAFDQAVSRRQHREPLWHITGRAPFLEIEVDVGPGVFIPRPETELLAHQAIAEAEAMVPSAEMVHVVDLCAGSGAIGLAIGHRVAHTAVTAIEASDDAAGYLERNVERILPDRGHVIIGDIAVATQSIPDGTVDLVVANPPYLIEGVDPLDVETAQGDPADALWADDGGMAMIVRVVEVAQRLLRPGGVVLIEHGVTHGGPTCEALSSAGFRQTATENDLLGRPRFSRGVAGSR